MRNFEGSQIWNPGCKCGSDAGKIDDTNWILMNTLPVTTISIPADPDHCSRRITAAIFIQVYPVSRTAVCILTTLNF